MRLCGSIRRGITRYIVDVAISRAYCRAITSIEQAADQPCGSDADDLTTIVWSQHKLVPTFIPIYWVPAKALGYVRDGLATIWFLKASATLADAPCRVICRRCRYLIMSRITPFDSRKLVLAFKRG